MTIDDILEENARQRAEIKWLNDIITNNISELAAQIANNALEIQNNKDNDGLISGRVTMNEGNIIKTNRRVDENAAYLSNSLHPIGTILAWYGPHLSSTDLPSGWQPCDGSYINRGPMEGQTTPDLNGAGLFIRGGADNVAGQMEEDSVQDHQHIDSGHQHTVILHHTT